MHPVIHYDAAVTQSSASRLNALQRLGERNYALLMSLSTGNKEGFAQSDGTQFIGYGLSVQILTQSPYTSLVHVQHMTNPLPIAADVVQFRIRLYHDVCMAEVVRADHQKPLAPRYDYPNPNMHQPDEKIRTNHFLYDWLMHHIHQVPCTVASD